MARPRPTGSPFSPYVWAATAADVAAAHRLSPAQVLRFDANLPAFPAPLPIPAESALADRGEYPEGSYRELREAAAGYAGCAAEEVAVDAGADGLIGLVAKVFLAPGRRAVVERPTYPLYSIASALEGAKVRDAPRRLAALAEAARGAHVLWLCNPGNPSGALFRAAEIARVADELPETLVCVDEAYFEYCAETVAPLALERSNLVCVRTLSKAFGLAGLRVGYAVAAHSLAAELTARRAPAPISATAAALGAAALRRPSVAAEVAATVS
ncbi:MAG: aminotransferase class I/II-fold pyridoxal phosphate-dependent enzyme, partial [Actinomycetota bacterium]|nr:aminotransferase class I/II-fold pyridoxal phosphate-dependent enzyme [Actinomycetota bacterium]